MIDFNEFWNAFAPDDQFANRYYATRDLWDARSPTDQQAMLDWLRSGKNHKPNPYFFVLDFAASKRTMSFDDYYKRYGTTEEINGWKRVFKPEERTTVYVKD